MSKKKAIDSGLDPEAVALSKVVGALADLQSDAQQRVLRYAAERFKITTMDMKPTSISSSAGAAEARMPASQSITSPSQFADAGEIIERAHPRNGVMRALVVGYWFQRCQNKANFTGQEVNDSLKALGHASANITTDMNNLKNRTPALIQQVAKSGKAQQARKKYRLTTAGITAVTKMLNGQTSEDDE